MTRNERRLKAVEQEMERYSKEIQDIWAKADEEDRETTTEERGEVEERLKAIETLKGEKSEVEAAIKVEEDVKSVSKGIGAAQPVIEAQQQPERLRVKSLGEQFVESERYKDQKTKGFAGKWSTGMIQLDTKASPLVEGDNSFLTGGTPGEGGALVPLDQRPGVQPTLFERLTVADLFASGMTNSNAINYVVETVATSGAAVVAEAGEKPESTLEFENVQEAVKKIATFLTVSDEMLEDAAALQSYINARLSLFVRIKEEEELLHGAGGGNFLGLEPRIPADNKFVVSDADAPNAADHIYEAITVARRSFLEPDGVIVHPDDWADLRLLKDGNDNYIGGSPFSNTGSEPGESLWGKRVVVTQACIPSQAVVGAFATGAQVFRKGGLSVEATNSHDTNFQFDLTAIRAEQREALAVYRPEAFAIADLGGAS
jgi:HK97 family phage major capsid protein